MWIRCAGNNKIVVLLTMWLCHLDIFLSIPVTLFMRSLLWKFINTSRLGEASRIVGWNNGLSAARRQTATGNNTDLFSTDVLRTKLHGNMNQSDETFTNMHLHLKCHLQNGCHFVGTSIWFIYAVLTVLRFHPEHSIARNQWNVKSRICVRHLLLTWHNYTEGLSWHFNENSRPQRNFPKLGTELYLHGTVSKHR